MLGLSILPLDAIAGSTARQGLSYGSHGQKLDLCSPSKGRRQTGLIFIHGGGFASGKRGDMLGYCKLFAQGGFPGATISYRSTSQRHAFPKALEDVSEAVAWMRSRPGIDKVVLIGYSAGATLALSVGLADRSGIAGVVGVAGVTDFQKILDGKLPARLRSDLMRYIGKAPTAAVSPVSQVTRNDPPVFLFHGKEDPLVPVEQSVSLARKLDEAGVKVLLRIFENAGHEIMLPNPHLKALLRETTGFLAAIDRR